MERKKDKSRSVILIRLFARPAALWWETGGGSGAVAAISLTPSRDWCVIEGLCEIMSISSRSSVPLGLAGLCYSPRLSQEVPVFEQCPLDSLVGYFFRMVWMMPLQKLPCRSPILLLQASRCFCINHEKP